MECAVAVGGNGTVRDNHTMHHSSCHCRVSPPPPSPHPPSFFLPPPRRTLTLSHGGCDEARLSPSHTHTQTRSSPGCSGITHFNDAFSGGRHSGRLLALHHTLKRWRAAFALLRLLLISSSSACCAFKKIPLGRAAVARFEVLSLSLNSEGDFFSPFFFFSHKVGVQKKSKQKKSKWCL